MKEARILNNIWDFPRKYYINLAVTRFSATFSMMIAIPIFMLLLHLVGDVLLLPVLTQNYLIRYVMIPVGLAFLFDKARIDDKRPLAFLGTILVYVFKNKKSCMGKKITLRKGKTVEYITCRL